MIAKKQHDLPAAAICLALGLILTPVFGALANDDPNDDWRVQDFPYAIVDQALADALREFAHNLRLPIDISENVKGRIENYRHDGSSGDFLGYLEQEHGLDWVIEGQQLYVSPKSERIARSWPGDAAMALEAEAMLEQAGLGDDRYPIEILSGQGRFAVTAPPRFMTRAAPMIDRLMTPKATRTVNIIHGGARGGGT